MKCPCGGRTKVVDSRFRKKENAVIRKRECSKCKRKFSTLETEVSELIRSVIRRANDTVPVVQNDSTSEADVL